MGTKLAVVRTAKAQEIRCGGCLRRLGVAVRAGLNSKIYCNEWCLREGPLEPECERNDTWRMLRAMGQDATTIARLYNVSNTAVYKTTNRT